MKNKKIIISIVLIAVILITVLVVVIASNKNSPGDESGESSVVNPSSDGKWVEIYETTGTKSKLLERQSDMVLSKYDEGSMNISVVVDSTSEKQNFYGCGLAMTHSSAYLLMNVSQELRTEILTELFGEEGARLSCIRIPIGASDYVETSDFFTCDDIDLSADVNATDMELKNFSIEHDKNIIAVMKEVYEINPNVTVLAAPWSAPAWMKTSQTLKGGSLKDEYIDVYAKYLLKFVEEYEKEGIVISRLAVINEPLVNALGYPHMKMQGDQQVKVFSAFAKLLDEKGRTSPKLMAYEHNYMGESDITAQAYIDLTMASDAAKHICGTSFHAYAGSHNDTLKHGIQYMRENYPNMESYITEITEHSGSVDFALNTTYSANNIVISPINDGNSMALYWNAVLSSDGKPVLGNPATCFGIISLDEMSDGNYHYNKNAAYYSMAHVSQFAYAVNGNVAKALGAESSNASKINATALKRADGAVVVVVQNTNDSTYEEVDIVVDGNSLTYRILPQSIVTFVFGGSDSQTFAASTIDNVEFVATGLNAFDVTLKTSLGTDAKLYFTRTDNFDEAKAFAVNAQPKDDKIVFSLSKGDMGEITKYSKDVYLWAVKDSNKACLPLTFPSYSPYYTINDKGYGIVSFAFDSKTSWSSYCDPAGKTVYRSNSLTWDSSAELVASDLGIILESYTDRKFDSSKPYYYVTISAKNGICKFVSLALLKREDVIGDASVKVALNNDGKAMLYVEANVLMDTEYELLIRTFTEEFTAPNISTEKGKLKFEFDPSVLSKVEVWYDIVIRQSVFGREYDLYTESNLGGGEISESRS